MRWAKPCSRVRSGWRLRTAGEALDRPFAAGRRTRHQRRSRGVGPTDATGRRGTAAKGRGLMASFREPTRKYNLRRLVGVLPPEPGLAFTCSLSTMLPRPRFAAVALLHHLSKKTSSDSTLLERRFSNGHQGQENWVARRPLFVSNDAHQAALHPSSVALACSRSRIPRSEGMHRSDSCRRLYVPCKLSNGDRSCTGPGIVGRILGPDGFDVCRDPDDCCSAMWPRGCCGVADGTALKGPRQFARKPPSFRSAPLGQAKEHHT